MRFDGMFTMYKVKVPYPPGAQVYLGKDGQWHPCDINHDYHADLIRGYVNYTGGVIIPMYVCDGKVEKTYGTTG